MPNCVNIKDIDMSSIKFQRYIDNKEKTILSIGRIEPIKGITDILTAFKLFKRIRPDWKLRIVGPLTNEKYVAELRELIKKENLSDSVTLVGPLYGDDLYMEMAKAHTYVIASHPLGDGRNNTLAYALFLGCQPVITDVGDLKEIIRPIGVKPVKPQNIIELAAGFEKAITNPQSIKKMRGYVRSELNWENYLPMLLNIFKEENEEFKIEIPRPEETQNEN
jgi:glycosyltransferase involved in cell wall biosynthesis